METSAVTNKNTTHKQTGEKWGKYIWKNVLYSAVCKDWSAVWCNNHKEGKGESFISPIRLSLFWVFIINFQVNIQNF